MMLQLLVLLMPLVLLMMLRPLMLMQLQARAKKGVGEREQRQFCSVWGWQRRTDKGRAWAAKESQRSPGGKGAFD